ncbi:MAG: gamma-glutamylcyclotransferase [Nitrospira sp. SB0677_bin_15]|nr:gamma-glutamylcyclotransferase [Nitrospira sp. SB0667_bin_9]MYD30461.1 gamma-glutamylcyclotransferase [Nitrospira sp. SB0661_bin_20]MYG39638.1 gamma-glutamylcyclotransferase [Nitrospira sp. SB0677_bin_15]MYH02406.1 gamma-glutamylcyclotransferase [Nitrospira sp. SB0675_bin_23]MYJ22478.1 gamma-glutamylcyclotransferase [Nitrospira sp. SB0673_bin_12]
MRVFIYAENLNPTQLKRRAPEHQFLFKAYLPDHTIHFPRFSSQWRCGLASITPSPGERVWGAAFELTDEDLKILDAYDGEVPEGAFRHLEVTVMTEDEQKELVTTHAANPIGKFRVKDDYLDFIKKGVKHWDLPEECLETWELFRPRK